MNFIKEYSLIMLILVGTAMVGYCAGYLVHELEYRRSLVVEEEV